MIRSPSMPAPNRRLFHRMGLAIPILFVLCQGCSVFPQLVRHRDPLSPEEHVRLGNSYEAQGLQLEAADQYKAALALKTNNIPALIAWGNLAFTMGDWNRAETC